MQVGVEIGGTFTDLVAYDNEGNITNCKVFSTPESPEKGALDALKAWGGEMKNVEVLIHGSTVATNAVLERKGASTLFLTTKGFKDILEIQRHERTMVYDLFYKKSDPLVSRNFVLEIDERIAADGSIIHNLSGLNDLIKQINLLIKNENIVSIAIALINSYKNTVHEKKLAKYLSEKVPNIPITLSSEILPEFREYERANTTVMSAYLRPVIEKYMKKLENGLSRMGFNGDLHIMQSNGGIFPISAAQKKAVNVILSGPAAGVVGAIKIASLAGYKNILTLDMGGTSTDVCLVKDKEPLVTNDNQIDGLPIRVPMINIITIGAGGGSIAWRDEGGMLKVGPQSSGAYPGPASYNKGGQLPTVTDANLLRGLLRSNKFFGGKLKLEVKLARNSITELSKKLDMDPHTLSEGICKVANSNMMSAIRLATIEHGHDPRDFTIVAFGGAGGLHACHLAEELEIGRVLIPNNPGLLSAYGLSVSNFKRSYVQTELNTTKKISKKKLHDEFEKLKNIGKDELSKYRISQEKLKIVPSLDLRYIGQNLDINIEVCLDDLSKNGLKNPINDFHKAYKNRCGHSFPEEDIELVNYRLNFIVPRVLPVEKKSIVKQDISKEKGEIYQNNKWIKCAYLKRSSLPVGFLTSGPVVIEEPTATTFVPGGWNLKVDQNFNLIIKKK